LLPRAGPAADCGSVVVARRLVASVRARVLTEDENALAVVAGNDIARPGHGPADRVSRGSVEHHAPAVAHGRGARGVRSDQVALDQVARGGGAQCLNINATLAVVGDDVAGFGARGRG